MIQDYSANLYGAALGSQMEVVCTYVCARACVYVCIFVYQYVCWGEMKTLFVSGVLTNTRTQTHTHTRARTQVLYLVFAFFCFLAPSVTNKLGARVTMFLGNCGSPPTRARARTCTRAANKAGPK